MGKGSETEKQSKLKSKKFKLNSFPGIGVSPNQRRLRFWRMLETVCVTGSFSPGSQQAELLRKWLAPFKPDDLKQGPLLLLPLEVGGQEGQTGTECLLCGGSDCSCTQGLHRTLTSQRFPVFSDFPGGHGVGDLEQPFVIVSGLRSRAAGPVFTSSSGCW